MRGVVIACVVAVAGCDSVLGINRVADVSGDRHDDDDNAPDSGLEADAPGAGPTGCPADYAQLLTSTGSHYLLMAAGTAWPDAAAACAAHSDAGGITHLVVVSDDAERAELAASFAGRESWIGLSDRIDFDVAFRWVTAEASPLGVLTSTAWDAGEPDLGGAGCVALSPDGRFADDGCNATRAYACECDAYADVPSNR